MRNKIYVVTSGPGWKVTCDHCSRSSIKATQAEAIAEAKAHVRAYPQGTLSQILVQGRDSKFRTEWTYGKDPYPPKG
jgi:hypothetical protein